MFNSTYRSDIDGLRAIAVISVIGFHAFPQFIPGGFVGVDIFFVISGFLITNILLKEVADATFSIQAFYVRRIRRLFPSLIVILSFCIISGWVILLTHEYRQLGKHILAAVGFISNIVFWTEAGYFDTNADLKPLLHLWSLGIEEQFYLIWPLIIIAIIKMQLNFSIIAGILALISFITNIILINTEPATAFFMPYSRLWELILGGLLAHLIFNYQDKIKDKQFLLEIFAIVGLILISIAVLFIDKNKNFPGWWALLPTGGTLLLIGAGPNTYINTRLLSWHRLVFIGLISYPLYLWHWPLFSLTRIIIAESPSILTRLTLIMVSFILAWMTYNYIEYPIRYAMKSTAQSKKLIINLSLSMLSIFGMGWLIQNNNITVRLHNLSTVLSTAAQDWYYPGDKRAFIPGTANESILFFGDSYIIQLYPRIKQIATQVNNKRNVTFHTAVACVPIPGISRTSDPKCITYANNGYNLAASPSVKIVVIGGSWIGMLQRGDYYMANDKQQTILDLNNPVILRMVLNAFTQELIRLKSLGKEIYVVLNPPGGGIADPGIISRLNLFYTNQLNIKHIPITEHLQRTGLINTEIRNSAQRAGAFVIDPMYWICSATQCEFTDQQGVPYYKDATHFRATFIRHCVKDFDKLLIASTANQLTLPATTDYTDTLSCFQSQ